MRNRTLIVVLVILLSLAFVAAAMAAPAKPAKPVAKPVAKTAAKPVAKPAAQPGKFDLDATLAKFWKLPDSTVVGTVDGAKVTKGELVKSLWYWNGSAVLGDILTAKMVEQAAKKQGVTVTPAELQAKQMEAVQRMNLKSVDELLEKFNVSRDRFVSSIKMSTYAEKAVKKTLKIEDTELAQYIKARHILVQFPATETDAVKKDEAAKKKLEGAIARIKGGEDFAKVAQEISDDPGSKTKGGVLEWFTHGRMLPEFEKVAFALKVSEMSEPVKTAYGYHVIQLLAVGKDATGQDKEDLRNMILEQKLPMEMQRWFQEVQSKSQMKNLLAPPAPKEPTPVVKPQPPPKPAVRPTPPPPPPANTNNTPPPPPPGPPAN